MEAARTTRASSAFAQILKMLHGLGGMIPGIHRRVLQRLKLHRDKRGFHEAVLSRKEKAFSNLRSQYFYHC